MRVFKSFSTIIAQSLSFRDGGRVNKSGACTCSRKGKKENFTTPYKN